MKACKLIFLATLAPVTALAGVVEHCPRTNDIAVRSSTYVAPTQDGKGEWLGVTQTGSGGRIVRFEEAIFYPDDAAMGSGSPRGELAKCTYKVEQGVVDLSYKPSDGARPKVTLENSHAWSKETGPFGLVYYQCAGAPAEHCAFRES